MRVCICYIICVYVRENVPCVCASDVAGLRFDINWKFHFRRTGASLEGALQLLAVTSPFHFPLFTR